MTKRVIITGGTGLIGKPLALALARDYDVVVLSRNPSKHTIAGVKVVQWDAVSAEGWGELADGAFAIINLAGAGIADSRWTKARKEIILNSRLNAGNAVVEAVRAATVKPKIVMQASAVGYYGDRAETVLHESDAAGEGFLADVCKQWEQSTARVEEMGVRRIILRTGVVLSMDGGALPKMMMPFKLLAGGNLGTGDQWMSWIDLEDQVRAMRYLLEDADASGPYNITAPTPQTNAIVTNKIGTVLQKPVLLPAPTFALKLALGEMSAVVLESTRVVPTRLIKEGYKFRYSDVETSLRTLILNGS